MQFLVETKDNGFIEWNKYSEILKNEAKYVYEFSRAGSIRNIWFTKNKDAVIFIEADNESRAKEIIEGLPLVKEMLLTYSIQELFMYTGYERLFEK